MNQPATSHQLPLTRPERLLFGLSLMLAPLLFAASTFFWRGDQTGIVGSTLHIFGNLFWVLAFASMFRLLRQVTPWYAAGGFLVAAYGAVCGGAAFAFRDLFMALFQVSREASLQALSAYPFVANAVFWFGGPAFPLSLLVLGIVLAWTRTVPLWVGGLIALGGALFPFAHIPDIALLAHAVDLLVLIPVWYIGVHILRTGSVEFRGSAQP